MNAEELKEKIRFKEYTVSWPVKSMRAELCVSSEIYFDERTLKASRVGAKQIRNDLQRQLTERLLRDIYKDMRNALYAPVIRLLKAHPMDFRELENAREALFQAAMRQPPKDFK